MPTMRYFFRSEHGSMAPLFVVVLVPILAAVGFAVDYSSATATRASMQEALDASVLSITTLAKDTTKEVRQKALQDAFAANGGAGTATLDSYVIQADGTSVGSVSASYDMPTNFMQIVMIRRVPIGVSSAVNKTATLAKATFKIGIVSGYWDKTMTLYGTAIGKDKPVKLMDIGYAYNKFGDPKGYGTTTLRKVVNGVATQVGQRVCTTRSVTNKEYNEAKPGEIKQAKASSRWLTSCTDNPADNKGAEIDVQDMASLYLEMKMPNPNVGWGGTLPAGTKTTLRSDDKATSDRLFYEKDVDGKKVMVQIPKSTVVDIFSIVPCGETSKQAWEDGGSLNNKADEVDFAYEVSGKCNFSRRPSTTVLTQ